MSGTPSAGRQNDAEQRGGKTHGDFLIIGLGASAGGIKALKEFFAHVPAQSGMAYVVILHLSPNHDSQLAEILQLTTEMPRARHCHAPTLISQRV